MVLLSETLPELWGVPGKPVPHSLCCSITVADVGGVDVIETQMATCL